MMKMLIVWSRQFMYGFLIVCVGGVGPLTYLDALSPHQDLPRYHLALFETASSRSLDDLPPQLVEKTRHHFNDQQAQWLASVPFALAVSTFASELSPGYLFGASIDVDFYLPTRASAVFNPFRQESSAWLSPPDEPPKPASIF